jgi:hypothetical protein
MPVGVRTMNLPVFPRPRSRLFEDEEEDEDDLSVQAEGSTEYEKVFNATSDWPKDAAL